MRFLNLVQKHYRVWMTAHFLGKLSTLLIAYISRRRTHKTRHSKLLHILAHIYTYERIGCVKHVLCQLLCKMGLADTCRT